MISFFSKKIPHNMYVYCSISSDLVTHWQKLGRFLSLDTLIFQFFDKNA
ncbi:hypothetical protein AO383_1216 [Moraxella catarrhalis]|nr:hypothetical protein AO383_1216 [Moraxella catarrhalis]